MIEQLSVADQQGKDLSTIKGTVNSTHTVASSIETIAKDTNRDVSTIKDTVSSTNAATSGIETLAKDTSKDVSAIRDTVSATHATTSSIGTITNSINDQVQAYLPTIVNEMTQLSFQSGASSARRDQDASSILYLLEAILAQQEAIKGALDSDAQTRMTASSLIQKPSVQRSFCDMASLHEVPGEDSGPDRTARQATLHNHPVNMTTLCQCRKKQRNIKRTGLNLGLLQIYRRDEEISKHRRDCPYYLCPQRKSAWEVVIRPIVRNTIAYSFFMKRGAGGSALGSGIFTRAHVREDSPAHKLIEGLFHDPGCYEDTILQIRTMFDDGAASPYDVDAYGRNLLDVSYAGYNYSRRHANLTGFILCNEPQNAGK